MVQLMAQQQQLQQAHAQLQAQPPQQATGASAAQQSPPPTVPPEQRPPPVLVESASTVGDTIQAQLSSIKAAHVHAEAESPFLWEGAAAGAPGDDRSASAMWSKVRGLARSGSPGVGQSTLGQTPLGEAVNAHVLRERIAVVEMDARLQRSDRFVVRLLRRS